jgi:flagellar L-ring protein precursor FlgH
MYERYLASARRSPAAPASAWMADLTMDQTARRLNDLVTINVIESLSATAAADAGVSKSSDANVRIPAVTIANQLNRLFPFSSESNFNGAGGTTRTTQLSARLTARVVEVLPNGDLAVEGVREVDINGDRALVVLTGVIRAIDVQPGNVISSSRIGQLQIKSLSQGLIKDSLTPGWLIRVFNKIF